MFGGLDFDPTDLTNADAKAVRCTYITLIGVGLCQNGVVCKRIELQLGLGLGWRGV